MLGSQRFSLLVLLTLSLASTASAQPPTLAFELDDEGLWTPLSASRLSVASAYCSRDVPADFCRVFLFQASFPRAIPDNNPLGMRVGGFIADSVLEDREQFGCVLRDVNVAVEISHPAVGELEIDFLYESSHDVFSPIRMVDNPPFCSSADVDALFDDQGATPPNGCDPLPPTIRGITQPIAALGLLNGQSVATLPGQDYRIYGVGVRDLAPGNTGTLDGAAIALAMDCVASPCIEDLENGIACLQGGRFRIETTSSRGGGQPYELQKLSDSVVLGSYQNTDNLVTMDKIVDNCSQANVYTYWHGGMTQYATEVTVSDSELDWSLDFSFPAEARPPSFRTTFPCTE